MQVRCAEVQGEFVSAKIAAVNQILEEDAASDKLLRKGGLEAPFDKGSQKLAEFVELNEPGLISYSVYLVERETR